MKVYCVIREEARTDLDHVVYATTSKVDAERFANAYDFIDYNGNPNIEVLDVVESEERINNIRDEIEETIESYVCDKEENTMKAQGMLNAMQMTFDIIDKYTKEQTE